jgi:acetyl-CoA acetyltransferase family protein
MKSAYILAAYRTPGCKAKRGKLKDVRPDDLAAAAIAGLLERTGIDPMTIEDIIIGCAFPEGEQGMNMARVAAMKAGVPYQVPAQTVNRFCSSGLQSIASAAERIIAGFADCIVAGGAESMSMIPMGGGKYSANPSLVAAWPEAYASMGITAELVADKYQISRDDQDAFAAASHVKAAAAIAAGVKPVQEVANPRRVRRDDVRDEQRGQRQEEHGPVDEHECQCQDPARKLTHCIAPLVIPVAPCAGAGAALRYRGGGSPGPPWPTG